MATQQIEAQRQAEVPPMPLAGPQGAPAAPPPQGAPAPAPPPQPPMG